MASQKERSLPIMNLQVLVFVSGRVPFREPYPTEREKENHLQNWFFRVYVSSQEGNSPLLTFQPFWELFASCYIYGFCFLPRLWWVLMFPNDSLCIRSSIQHVPLCWGQRFPNNTPWISGEIPTSLFFWRITGCKWTRDANNIHQGRILSVQTSIIPKPEMFRAFWGGFPDPKPPIWGWVGRDELLPHANRLETYTVGLPIGQTFTCNHWDRWKQI